MIRLYFHICFHRLLTDALGRQGGCASSQRDQGSSSLWGGFAAAGQEWSADWTLHFVKYLAANATKYCKKGCSGAGLGRIRDSSGDLKSGDPDFRDFGSKLTHFARNPP